MTYTPEHSGRVGQPSSAVRTPQRRSALQTVDPGALDEFAEALARLLAGWWWGQRNAGRSEVRHSTPQPTAPRTFRGEQ